MTVELGVIVDGDVQKIEHPNCDGAMRSPSRTETEILVLGTMSDERSMLEDVELKYNWSKVLWYDENPDE